MTASLHVGVVREPWYRKYFDLSLGKMGSNLNGFIFVEVSEEISRTRRFGIARNLSEV